MTLADRLILERDMIIAESELLLSTDPNGERQNELVAITARLAEHAAIGKLVEGRAGED